MRRLFCLAFLIYLEASAFADCPLSSAGSHKNVDQVMEQAQQIIAALAHSEQVSVQIPGIGLKSRKPYNTLVSREVMKCITSLDRELQVPKDETYAQQLRADIDPAGWLQTDVARFYHLSLDDLLLILDYANTAYYGPINRALRSGDLKNYGCFVEALKRSLKKFPEYRGEVIRGTNLPSDELAQHLPGKVVTYRAFTSMTAGDYLSEYFRDQPVVLKVLSKHGRDIRSINETEGEVLFLPGSRFKVISLGKSPEDTSVTMITLLEVD